MSSAARIRSSSDFESRQMQQRHQQQRLSCDFSTADESPGGTTTLESYSSRSSSSSPWRDSPNCHWPLTSFILFNARAKLLFIIYKCEELRCWHTSRLVAASSHRPICTTSLFLSVCVCVCTPPYCRVTIPVRCPLSLMTIDSKYCTLCYAISLPAFSQWQRQSSIFHSLVDISSLFYLFAFQRQRIIRIRIVFYL